MNEDLTLYCAYCGDVLTDTGRGLACVRGDMPLSQDLERRLRAFAAQPPDKTPRAMQLGGHWFCPVDGRPIAARDGVLRCGTCNRVLNPLVRHFIEYHPHA
jgi:hypothetical protein